MYNFTDSYVCLMDGNKHIMGLSDCSCIPICPIVVLTTALSRYIIQVNEKVYKLERIYRDCIKMTRDKTRIYSMPHDAPGA